MRGAPDIDIFDFIDPQQLPRNLLIALILVKLFWPDIQRLGSRLIDAKIEDVGDRRDHQQERELLTFELQAQDLATYRARQREMDNQALIILKEQLEISRNEMTNLQRSSERQERIIAANTDNTRVLAGAVEKNTKILERIESKLDKLL